MTALLHAYDISADGAATPLTVAQIAEPVPTGRWRWVHLLRTEADVEAILTTVGLPDSSIEALLVEETRPRTWSQGDRTLMVLRGVNLNQDVGDNPLIAIRLCLSENLVVTCRKFRFRALEDLTARIDAGKAPPSSAAFVVDLVNGLSFRFAARIADLDETLDEIEADDATDREDRLTALRRDLVPLGRFMAPNAKPCTGCPRSPPSGRRPRIATRWRTPRTSSCA